MKTIFYTYIIITILNLILRKLSKTPLHPLVIFCDIAPFLNLATMTAYLQKMVCKEN